MSILVIVLVFLAMTGVLAHHVNNESQLSKRILKSGTRIKHLLDARNQNHIDLEITFKKHTIFKQIRILEYYMHVLDENYNQYMHKKSIFKRVETIEQSLDSFSLGLA
ncbi:MAG: hypothetical protein ACEPOZ_06295 [Marinifilaceae bacterium]|jgi:hypothetical protein